MSVNDLSRLSQEEIDALPFGYIGLSPEGMVRKYNRFEADLARKDPREVLGRNFFQDVAPCTQVAEFEGRFREFAEGRVEEPVLSFNFEFRFRHGTQKVRIGMVRSPLENEVIVTVNRLRDVALPLSAEITPDAGRGLLLDAASRPVVAAGADFWRGLDRALAGVGDRERVLHQAGVEWGLAHALRVEGLVQRQHRLALREVELHVALEYLSSSLGVMGLGRFDVELGYRRRGLILISHASSPFAASGAREPACALLAGLHAGLLSHLAGRRLAGHEISCSLGPDEACRFLVATESRLQRLLDPEESSADAELLARLGRRETEAAVAP